MLGESDEERVIPIESLKGIRVGRAPADRLAGRPSLVLEPRVGPTIRVGSVAQPGVIPELARRIALDPEELAGGSSGDEVLPGGDDEDPYGLVVLDYLRLTAPVCISQFDQLDP